MPDVLHPPPPDRGTGGRAGGGRRGPPGALAHRRGAGRGVPGGHPGDPPGQGGYRRGHRVAAGALAGDGRRAGWAPERWLGKALGRSPAQRSLALDAGADVVAQVVAELGEQRSTWGRTDAIKAMARRLPPGLVATADEARAWIEAGTDAVVAHRQIVRLVAPASVEVPVALCRRDGLATTQRHGGARFTTRTTLALEGSVIEAAGRGREAGRAVASATAIDAAVADRGLGEDQALAVLRVCGGGEALVCLVGPAGAGKTRSVGAARLTWEASGVPVRGLAVSAVAAGVLTEEAGLASDTLAKFLCENAKVDPEPCWRLRKGEAVVLDEASMVASADLATLVAIVEAAQAKVVLVGDHRQLGAVGAGGLFRLLVADTDAAELTDARRFVEPWEAEASLRLRQGDASVVDEYERHGRLVGGDREEMVEAAFASWLGARSAGESVVVLAQDHVTVDALAMRARAVRVAAGEVEATGVAVGAQVAGVGDEVVTTENDRRLLTTGEPGCATGTAGWSSSADTTAPCWWSTPTAGNGWCSPVPTCRRTCASATP